MNFNNPSFDLATQKFVNITGTNVQIGAGVIGSLFDNRLQVSYGWNLNVECRRTYFGVGFGFIEIGKELTKYIGKSPGVVAQNNSSCPGIPPERNNCG